MRYHLEGYLEESRTSKRYQAEARHNEWHEDIEGAIRLYMEPRQLALLSLYFGHLHDDNIPPEDALEYR